MALFWIISGAAFVGVVTLGLLTGHIRLSRVPGATKISVNWPKR